MPNQFCTTLVTYCLLGLVGVVSLTLPERLVSQASASGSGPQKIRVPGVVRDFQKLNTNFNWAPPGGNGHYAGNISTTLGAEDRPVFAGGGFKVAAQWRDKNSQPIAPHLYAFDWGAPETIPLATAPTFDSPYVLDSWSSAVGAYGGANVGPAPTHVVGAPMPVVTIPASLNNLTNQGDKIYSGANTLSTDLHCNNLTLIGTLNISGHRKILCEGVCALDTSAAITLNAGATLALYTKGGGSSWNHVVVGDPLKPGRVVIYHLGTTPYVIHNHANVYAVFISPSAALQLSNHASLYGRFIGKTIEHGKRSNVHIDTGAVPMDLCGASLADTAGTKGVNSNGGIVSAGAFEQWYKDVLGWNLSDTYAIQLVKNGSGIYELHSDAFFPVDNQLYGNEGDAHNYYFSYAMDTTFTYKSCAGQFFEFEGADDAWVFINGQLAIDLGGVLPDTWQYVEMDRLGLTDGNTYTLHLFYAQRNAAVSRFHIRTNVELEGEDVTYAVSAGAD